MMQKSNSSKSRRARVLALIPAAALGLAVINTPLVSNALERLSDSGTEILISHKGSENLSLNNRAESSSDTTAPDDKKPVKAAESIAQFPGGDGEMFKFINENIKFPESEMDRPAGRYRVILTFQVEADGKVGEITIVRSEGEAFDNEAKRVVKLFPKFKPATIDGKPVKSALTFPVVFAVTDKDKKQK